MSIGSEQTSIAGPLAALQIAEFPDLSQYLHEVRFGKGVFQTQFACVCIDRRGRDVLMAKQPLQVSQIDTLFEKQGRTCVSEHMWGYVPRNSSLFGMSR